MLSITRKVSMLFSFLDKYFLKTGSRTEDLDVVIKKVAQLRLEIQKSKQGSYNPFFEKYES
jgi:hypothetical protein